MNHPAETKAQPGEYRTNPAGMEQPKEESPTNLTDVLTRIEGLVEDLTNTRHKTERLQDFVCGEAPRPMTNDTRPDPQGKVRQIFQRLADLEDTVRDINSNLNAVERSIAG